MYYVINDIENPSIDEDEDEAPFLEIHEELLVNPRQGWHSGYILTDPPEKVIEIEATPNFGYSGPPPDYYDDAISLMSPRLAKVLQAAGVDNLDLYPALITYRDTVEKYDFYAFNLLGLVQAIDVEKSKTSNPDGNLLVNSSIDGFCIDPKLAKEILMFRLAENVMTVVVHEKIKEAIEKAGINTFGFMETQDWIII